METLMVALLFAFTTFQSSSNRQVQNHGPGKPILATVCNVRAHPQRFLRKDITIHAEVLAEMHGIAYFDPNCKGEGVSHGWKLPDADHSVEEFDDKITSLEVPPPHQRYSATFVGQIEIDSRTKRVSFRLKSVRDLKEIPADSPASF